LILFAMRDPPQSRIIPAIELACNHVDTKPAARY
jgi:hypothetical protein